VRGCRGVLAEGVVAVAELGTVTRALLGIVRDGADDHLLAQRICQACVDGLDIDGAAISLLTASSARETLWATDATAELLEDLQFTLNEGACMEAAATGRPVSVPDLDHNTHTARWPMFAAAVAEQTLVGALFALPLQWGAVNLGVLDLYRAAPGGLSELQWRDALAAAETAGLMLLGQRTNPADPADPAAAYLGDAGGWLDHSFGHRAEVHQATGMVLAQLGISATDALARLRAHAFVHQRLLIDVARDVVDRRLVFTEEMN
jgi:GAF domain/ANTAR domain